MDRRTLAVPHNREPGGAQYYEMRHVPPKRFPFLKPALTQWPLGLCVATHTPPISVTQRPPISDLSPKDATFLILWFCHPKTHHFNYLAQTLISHNNWSQDFKGFVACGQLDVSYYDLWFEGLLLKVGRGDKLENFDLFFSPLLKHGKGY